MEERARPRFCFRRSGAAIVCLAGVLEGWFVPLKADEFVAVSARSRWRRIEYSVQEVQDADRGRGRGIGQYQ